MQSLLKNNGIEMTKRQIAMDQNGDFSLNLTPATAAQMWKAGLLNESQLGAVANGGHARFSLAHNDLLVSSSAGFEKSARNDISTRFEAGKQAGPDTIEHFMGGGAEGRAAMANWLRGGFEMDRKGNWRLKPQVADTLQRDVQAIMAQTGWERAIARTAQDQNSFQISVSGEVSGGMGAGVGRTHKSKQSGASFGQTGGSLGVSSQEAGSTSEIASAQLNVVNFEVRRALANAEQSAARAINPADAFSNHLATEILGPNGLRNRYLGDADSGRGTVDVTAPVTSLEQNSLLKSGRFSTDLKNGPFDGVSSFKKSDGSE
jgi:conjugal transfer mating pair stabilization protein TraG